MATIWKRDGLGSDFDSVDDALRALSDRAESAIREGDRQGQDARSRRVRLRDEDGAVLFEGTLAEAAKLKLMSLCATCLVASYALFTAVGDASAFAEVFV